MQDSQLSYNYLYLGILWFCNHKDGTPIPIKFHSYNTTLIFYLPPMTIGAHESIETFPVIFDDKIARAPIFASYRSIGVGIRLPPKVLPIVCVDALSLSINERVF